MKRYFAIFTLFLAVTLLSGCGQNTEPQPEETTAAVATPSEPVAYAYEQGSKKKGDTGLCVVCVVKEGATEEEVAVESIDYEGKTYLFCNEDEKAVFISEPGKYAVQ